MTVPVTRQFKVASGTNNTPQLMEYTRTSEKFFILQRANVLLDAVNSTGAPAVSTTLVKNGADTPVVLEALSMNPGQSGRLVQGPVAMSPGTYQWRTVQTSATAAAYVMLVRFAAPLE